MTVVRSGERARPACGLRRPRRRHSARRVLTCTRSFGKGSGCCRRDAGNHTRDACAPPDRTTVIDRRYSRRELTAPNGHTFLGNRIQQSVSPNANRQLQPACHGHRTPPRSHSTLKRLRSEEGRKPCISIIPASSKRTSSWKSTSTASARRSSWSAATTLPSRPARRAPDLYASLDRGDRQGGQTDA